MLDGEGADGFAAHFEVLGAGGVIVENLRNLGAIRCTDPLVSVLPLRSPGRTVRPYARSPSSSRA